MSTASNRLGLAACALSLVFTGCHCKPSGPQVQVGEIAIVYDQGGTTITGPDGTYDFGKVGMGVSKSLKVTIENRGQGPLDLVSVEKTDGDNLKLGDTLDEMPAVFTMGFEAITLGAGVSQELDAEFDAPLELDPNVKTKNHSATILLRASNTAVGADTATLVFKGVAVSGECDLPSQLDFGAVALGDSLKQTIHIQNVSPITTTATVGNIKSNGDDAKDFTFAPESIMGDVNLLSGQTRDVVIEFTPTQGKTYVALLTLKAGDRCPEVTVSLIGTGVDEVLTCVPSPLDFGYISPGLSTQGTLTLSNSGIAPVTLTDLVAKVGTASSTEFKLLGPDSVTVPAAQRVVPTDGGSQMLVPGLANVQVTFAPTLLGPRLGNLTGATTLARQTMLGCPLRGVGGGPDIDVRPPAVDFGQVPYFATATPPFFVARKVTVQNLGTAPSPADAKANLHLGTKQTDGTYARPYWRVTAKNGDSVDAEICVGLYDDQNFPAAPCRGDLPTSGGGAYDPMVGIVADAAHGLLDIPIRITPSTANKNFEWDVVFLSNDPDEPEVTVNVKASSVVLPPCNYTATPALLSYGLVSPPTYKDLAFTIKNLGVSSSDVCLLTSLDLQPGTDATFTLPAGPITQQELMPGDTVTVIVRAAPTGNVGTVVRTATGAVQFGMSSPTLPQKLIQLSAQLATSCLTIAPDDLDFGTVQKDCSSAQRVFNIYNTCTTNVTVNGWGMQAAAGQPAGGPNCPGASPCPEFLIDGTPSFTAGSIIQAGGATPATFALRYHPIDLGEDSGGFVLHVTQNGQAVDYLVTLKGNGDTMGLNTDIFKQDSKPKADILLVIDNSCSMADKQTQLSLNFTSFIQYATQSNIDYHLGVITTDIDNPTTEGYLLGNPMDPKVLTPATPNVQALFQTKVKVGVNGGTEGTAEPAVKALTAPLITGVNAGFLRIDAVLAVVGISDAGDQSPLPVTVYENELRNIKGVQRASMFSYNRIGPFAPTPPAGCMYDDFTDTTKDAYLVQVFGGVKDEICTPDWSTTLTNLGKTAFGYRTNFFLTAVPDLSGGKVITVQLDAGHGPVTLAQVDVHGAPIWSYDATSNSVDFAPLYVPEPGTTLTITYYVTCN